MHPTCNVRKSYMTMTAHVTLYFQFVRDDESQADAGAQAMPGKRYLTWGMASRGLKSMLAQYGPLRDAAEMCCFAIVILGVLQIPAHGYSEYCFVPVLTALVSLWRITT